MRYGTCLLGLGVRVQGPESALRDVSSWTRSQSPGPGKCVTGRVFLDSESESRAFWAFQLFARAWTRSQSPGRSGRFSCSRGHGLGVRVQGVLGVSVARAGMDSESGSLAVALPTPTASIFPVGSWTFKQPRPTAPRRGTATVTGVRMRAHPNLSAWIRSDPPLDPVRSGHEAGLAFRDPATERGWHAGWRFLAGRRRAEIRSRRFD